MTVQARSAALAARDAVPSGKASYSVGPRRLYVQHATVEVTNGNAIGSRYLLAEIPSSAVMSSLIVMNDAITSAAADFGIYRTTRDGGAVVDADCFGSAVSIATAGVVGTNVLHESGVLDIAEIEQPLWQVLGYTSDPSILFDVVATLTAAATASGTLTVRVEYTQGN